mgnify:CR=1 FL=1
MLPQRHPSFERKIAFVARVLRVKLTYVSFELVRIFETFVAKSARVVVTSRVFGKVRAKKMILVKNFTASLTFVLLNIFFHVLLQAVFIGVRVSAIFAGELLFRLIFIDRNGVRLF